MTKIVIIAGGLATRMHPITEQIPKCLVPINGKPLIEHQLEFFRTKGFTDFIFCVAHLANKVQEYLGDGTIFGVSIKYVQEQKELLGTGGSLRLAKPLLDESKKSKFANSKSNNSKIYNSESNNLSNIIDSDNSSNRTNSLNITNSSKINNSDYSSKTTDSLNESNDFIVYYGDNITDMDFDKFLAAHKKMKGIATICMRPAPKDYKGSSIITLDDSKRVTTFLEKPTDEQRKKYENDATGSKIIYINSGIYAFNTRILDYIPENTVFDIAKQLFPLLIAKNIGVFGYPTTEFFREIGRVEKYEQFCKDVAGKNSIYPQNSISSAPQKAIFLDRDGVINMNVINLISPTQFELISDAASAIRKINQAGYLTIVVTNQPIISKGFCSFADMGDIHQKMKDELAKDNARIDKIYMCPHHPQSGFAGEKKELKFDCECRKPKPGLLLTAIKENNIDPMQSWMIGDSLTDVQAGTSAGVKTILLSTDNKEPSHVDSHLTFQTLTQAVDYILKQNGK